MHTFSVMTKYIYSLMGAHNILGNEVKIALASANIKMINPAK